MVGQLDLEQMEEQLSYSVVPTVTLAAHTLYETMLGDPLDEATAGVDDLLRGQIVSREFLVQLGFERSRIWLLADSLSVKRLDVLGGEFCRTLELGVHADASIRVLTTESAQMSQKAVPRLEVFSDRDSSMSLRDRRSGPHHNQATGSTTAGCRAWDRGDRPEGPCGEPTTRRAD